MLPTVHDSVYHFPMKIPEVKNISTKAVGKKKRGGSATGTNFSSHLNQVSEASSEASISSEKLSVTGVNSILGLQEVTDAPDRETQRQLVGWGENILDKLDEIRHGLLIGAIPKDRLINLAQTLRDRRAKVSDPRLLEIIDEIELRAEVELAKLSRIL